ncbi:Oidioi.mRNA.OKI2018_I69.chr2.g5709.t3.cds [Oikopleura dioica]|uniref:Oidioi.mRNA.OKI2018_I69.chr2.g5709.t3.cds n=1 Tax=Oikopleura dioica TaxID=34765 RepID=A0ABN7T0P0_OIKDI|nr:Oidioi.mRNA.OKI2018_I69.chr2.g5709.t3.cds [Oikopleura dioica]
MDVKDVINKRRVFRSSVGLKEDKIGTIVNLKQYIKKWKDNTPSKNKQPDGRSQSQRRRCTLEPSQNVKENMKNFWREIYVFDYSNGDKRRTAQVRSADFDDFFRKKRFSESFGPHAQFKELAAMVSIPNEHRPFAIQRKKFGRILKIDYDDEDYSTDATDIDPTSPSHDMEVATPPLTPSSRSRSNTSASERPSFDETKSSSGLDISQLASRFNDLETETQMTKSQNESLEATPRTISRFSSYMSEPACIPRHDMFIYEILNTQLNALWIEETFESLGELKTLFPHEKCFLEEVHDPRNDTTQLKSFLKEEAKALSWMNIATGFMTIFERHVSKVIDSFQPTNLTELESQQYDISGGTTENFKYWLKEQINKSEKEANPESPFCQRVFVESLQNHISRLTKLSTTTLMMMASSNNSSSRSRSGKSRVQEPYRIINHSILEKLISFLLKVRPYLEGQDELHTDLEKLVSSKNNKNGIPNVMDLTLADVFERNISVEMNSTWLESSLRNIRIRYVHNEFNPDAYPLPEWLPNLNGLYTFLLVTLARFPMTLCKHVLEKFESISSCTADHSNFIAEFHPVFDQCAVTIFCIETLALTEHSSTSDLLFNTIYELKSNFKKALKCYYDKVVIPPKVHLLSKDFDLHNILQRMNNISLFESDAESLGHVLKFEMKRFKDLSRRMHISTKPRIMDLFQDKAVVLMDVLQEWCNERIIKTQLKHLDDFLNITNEKDLRKPQITLPNGISFDRVPSEPEDQENFRDRVQKEILQQMLHNLRVGKNTFVDNEARGVFQFAFYLREIAEKAIGYRLKKTAGRDISQYLLNQDFCMVRVLNDNDSDFWIFCHSETIDRFVNGKSTVLEELFDLMQRVETVTPVTKDLLVRIDNTVDGTMFHGGPIAMILDQDDEPRHFLKTTRRAFSELDTGFTGSTQIASPYAKKSAFEFPEPRKAMTIEMESQISARASQESATSDCLFDSQQTMNSSFNDSQGTEAGYSQNSQATQSIEGTASEWHYDDGIFIFRKSALPDLKWTGKIFEIKPDAYRITPIFDIDMQAECELYILTINPGNERSFTQDFRDYLELVVKQTGITKDAKNMVQRLRDSVLKTTKTVQNVINEQLRVFSEIQNALLDVKDRASSEDEKFFHQENLDYLEKEYPNAIRRLYESLNNSYFTEMKKLTRKPINEFNSKHAFYQSYQKLALEIFYDWTTFETKKMRSYATEEQYKSNLRTGPATLEHKHLDDSFLQKLKRQDEQMYRDHIDRIMKAFDKKKETGDGAKAVDNRPKLLSQASTDLGGEGKKSFRNRCRLSAVKLDTARTEKDREKKTVGRVLTEYYDEDEDSDDVPENNGKKINFDFVIIRDNIAQGAFGKVHLGTRRDNGDQVVIKEIKKHNKTIEELTHYLYIEILANELLHHKNIVLYYGQYYEDSDSIKNDLRTFFLMFEYCEMTLDKEARNGISPTMIIAYTTQLMDAVEYMHTNSWVHRDIKPSNVFLKRQGQYYHVKLGDFGSAHQIADDLNVQTNIGTPAQGAKGCTFHYAAPEVHEKSGYGRSSDVWSIGCTVLEMITGKLPWTKGGKILQDISILYQLRERNDPMKYHGEIMEFTGYPFFAQNAKTFLKKCFSFNPDVRPSVSVLKRHAFLDHVVTLDDLAL